MDPSDTSDIIGAFTRSRGRARARARERLNTSEPSDVSDGPQMRMQNPGGVTYEKAAATSRLSDQLPVATDPTRRRRWSAWRRSRWRRIGCHDRSMSIKR